jgi:pyridoxal phosphate enzyme (YggS family)
MGGVSISRLRYKMSVKNNINFFNSTFANTHCKLVAVSKTKPIALIEEAYQAGQRIFGENKVQEMEEKYHALPKDIEWHMIGHLQTNKVKYIAPFVSLIHSVDSTKLLEEINKQGKKINRPIPILLQVYIAEEETKFGFDETEIRSFFEGKKVEDYPFCLIKGLMGMASLTDNEEKIRNEFRGLKLLFDTIKKTHPDNMQELSMGMSSDYQLAIHAGSTLVRIGTAIFGERNYTTTKK